MESGRCFLAVPEGESHESLREQVLRVRCVGLGRIRWSPYSLCLVIAVTSAAVRQCRPAYSDIRIVPEIPIDPSDVWVR